MGSSDAHSRQVNDLCKALQELEIAIRHLGSSTVLRRSAYLLRQRLRIILHVFRKNASTMKYCTPDRDFVMPRLGDKIKARRQRADFDPRDLLLELQDLSDNLAGFQKALGEFTDVLNKISDEWQDDFDRLEQHLKVIPSYSRLHPP